MLAINQACYFGWSANLRLYAIQVSCNQREGIYVVSSHRIYIDSTFMRRIETYIQIQSVSGLCPFLGFLTHREVSWVLGCVEKLKNTKSNYGYSYFIAPWYIETEKTWFFEFRDFLAWGVTASKFLWPLFKWKKIVSIIGFIVF